MTLSLTTYPSLIESVGREGSEKRNSVISEHEIKYFTIKFIDQSYPNDVHKGLQVCPDIGYLGPEASEPSRQSVHLQKLSFTLVNLSDVVIFCVP